MTTDHTDPAADQPQYQTNPYQVPNNMNLPYRTDEFAPRFVEPCWQSHDGIAHAPHSYTDAIPKVSKVSGKTYFRSHNCAGLPSLAERAMPIALELNNLDIVLHQLSILNGGPVHESALRSEVIAQRTELRTQLRAIQRRVSLQS